jgi:hypothetical protein
MPTFSYTVDDEPQSTSEHVLTPAQILNNAHIDLASHYLVQIDGSHRTSYEGKPNETIHMHEKMKFISVSVAPTPVS